MIPVYLFVAVVIIFFLASAIKILNEYERGVIFRLGRVLGTPKGPGLILPYTDGRQDDQGELKDCGA